jgi:hypothetical protein
MVGAFRSVSEQITKRGAGEKVVERVTAEVEYLIWCRVAYLVARAVEDGVSAISRIDIKCQVLELVDKERAADEDATEVGEQVYLTGEDYARWGIHKRVEPRLWIEVCERVLPHLTYRLGDQLNANIRQQLGMCAMTGGLNE